MFERSPCALVNKSRFVLDVLGYYYTELCIVFFSRVALRFCIIYRIFGLFSYMMRTEIESCEYTKYANTQRFVKKVLLYNYYL